MTSLNTMDEFIARNVDAHNNKNCFVEKKETRYGCCQSLENKSKLGKTTPHQGIMFVQKINGFSYLNLL